jgi:GUN4-like/TIR domain
MTEQQFDVFLCYNTEDRAAVISVAQQLKQNGLKPWMDVLELQPGGIWQFALEQQIESIGAAAVFIGKQGLGPWQNQEIYAFLQEFTYRNCSIIPVMLPGAPQQPKLPIFLRSRHWVNFRQTDPEPLSQLIWGITGQKPTPHPFGTTLAEKIPLSPEPVSSEPTPDDDLASEHNIDYTHLRDLLKAGQWKQADQETADLLLRTIGRESWSRVKFKDLSNFPCMELRELARLWEKYSAGKWGFSIQTRIWQDCGSPTIYGDDWIRFGDRIGWRKDGNWVDSSALIFDLADASVGELPSRPPYWGGGVGGVNWGAHLFPQVDFCGL